MIDYRLLWFLPAVMIFMAIGVSAWRGDEKAQNYFGCMIIIVTIVSLIFGIKSYL